MRFTTAPTVCFAKPTEITLEEHQDFAEIFGEKSGEKDGGTKTEDRRRTEDGRSRTEAGYREAGEEEEDVGAGETSYLTYWSKNSTVRDMARSKLAEMLWLSLG